MFKVGEIVTLPGSFVSRAVVAVRAGKEDGAMEYLLSYDETWFSEKQLTEARDLAAQRGQWQGVVAPRRGRIVNAHRLGRKGWR